MHLAERLAPLEPSFERKLALGDHLYDDARALVKIKRRLYELRHPSDYPGSPSPELATLLDRMAAAAPPGLARSPRRAKPALLRATGVHLAALDPVADEPSLRLLRQLAARQERHTAQLRSKPDGGPADIGALPVRLRAAPRELRLLEPLDVPARDEFVSVTEDGDYLARELYLNGAENHVPVEREEQRHFFHGLMDAGCPRPS